MDTSDTRLQNLLFLLTAAPVGLGCIIVSDDTSSDTEAATEGPVTSGATEQTSGATDADTDTPATTAATEATTDDPTEGNDTTEGMDTTAGGSDTEGGSAICVTYGDFVTDCVDENSGVEAEAYCETLLVEYYNVGGEPCVVALEDFLACLSGLTCEEFNGVDPVCEAENAAIDAACPFK
ncbi:MAG: hypothetical protein AB1Z98_30955 [Nannocystaceae bacterium]